MPSELETRDGSRASSRDLSGPASAALLGTVVAISVLAYGFASGGTKAVWILPDELGYGLLARSFATTGQFAFRGVTTLIYPLGYPALISPAWIGRGPVAGYDAAKWLNSLLMSLTAIPVFLLARRLLPNRSALLVAALTLVIPSMAYTLVLMSEDAFFLVFMLAMLAFVRALELPTARRQLVALLAILPVVAVRAEGIIVVPILLVGMALHAASASDRAPGRRARSLGTELWRFRATWAVLPLGVLLLVLAEAAVGKSPTSIFGRYASSLQAYPIGPTLRWSLYQLIDLELYVVVVPLVAAVAVAFSLLRRHETTPSQRGVAAVAVPAVAISILAAGAASESSQGGRGQSLPFIPPELHDRYCFFVVPLLFVLFAYWLQHRREFSNRALLPLFAASSALPLLLPYADVHANADFDAFALLPWSNGLIGGHNVHYAMAVTALLLCAIAVPSRKSVVLLEVCAVVLGLLIMNRLAASEVANASTRVPSSRLDDRSWVDRSVPASAKVAVVWKRDAGWSSSRVLRREQALWRAELFNRSIAAYFDLAGAMHYNLPAGKARLAGGALVLPGTGATRYRYVLTDSSLPVAGRVIARDRRAGLLLYRLRAPSRP